MNIEIKNRFNGEIIIVGEYESIKDALQKNREADLCEADLCEADLREADLCEANLCGADLCGANLCGANLCGADLRGANLREADLREADLRGADLCGANLCGANLRGANLREADLREADLRGADLRGANLCGANLCEAKNIKLPIITIIGSRHTFQFINNIIKIGCHEYSVDYWGNNYQEIGNDEGYTEEQIKEYGRYIQSVKNLMEE